LQIFKNPQGRPVRPKIKIFLFRGWDGRGKIKKGGGAMEKIYKFEQQEMCIECGKIFNIEDMIHIKDEEYDEYEGYFCQNCHNKIFVVCPVCGNEVPRKKMVIDVHGNKMCVDCAMEHRGYCNNCGTWHYKDELKKYKVLRRWGINDMNICKNCEINLVSVKCEKCGREYYYKVEDYKLDNRLREIIESGLCDQCFKM
jgi:DNA-directed RNA polymerase subunit RPC12/RpoP